MGQTGKRVEFGEVGAGAQFGGRQVKLQFVQGELAIDRDDQVDQPGARRVVEVPLDIRQGDVTDERAGAPDTEVGEARIAVEVVSEMQHTMEALLAIKHAEQAEGGAEDAEPHHAHRERFARARRRDVREGVGDDAGEVGHQAPGNDEALVFLVERVLTRKGFKVSSFTDPRLASEALRAHPQDFDLLVTDYNMPGFCGVDLLREARAVRPDLPVALASGYVTAEIEQRAIEEGVGALIHKPNDVEEFCEIVQQLVHGTRAEH